MIRKTRPYRQALLEALADPGEAANYLNVALEDFPQMFSKASLNVVQAKEKPPEQPRKSVPQCQSEGRYHAWPST